MNAEDTACSAKLVVDCAKIDLLDTELSQERSTHDTRLYSDVQNALSNDRSINSRIRVALLAIRVEVALGSILITLIGGS
jgi:hypothetical protein